MAQMANEVGQTIKTVVIPQKSWANGVTDALSEIVKVNGRCTQIEFKASNATNGITFTLTAESVLAGTLYTLAAIPENATTVLKLAVATTDIGQWSANGDVTFTITPSGDPGASGVNVDVHLQFE